MYPHEKITVGRIEQTIERIAAARYESSHPLKLEYSRTAEPVPFSEIRKHMFKPLALDRVWGRFFDCAWIRATVTVPRSFKGKHAALYIVALGEGCVYDTQGNTLQGITCRRLDDRQEFFRKCLVPVLRRARGGEQLTFFIDAAANDVFGAGSDGLFQGGRGAVVERADLVVWRRDVWDLYEDCDFLWNLRNALPETHPRRGRLMFLLNELCNLWEDDPSPALVKRCRALLAPEIARPANASAIQLSAIGHAHMDVAWLWPLRETARKMVRTFTTALKLMEEYPDYKFGVSQPQVFQMIKDGHPKLYRRIKRAVKAKRLEPQGAMWVEADCNIPSGESLVRQVLYGKRFFKKEFGVEIAHLWLPDVFGYSANLPQILKRAGVDYFLTTKINWNQWTDFPHKTFLWRGIDGSEVFTHFPPACNYNAKLTPQELLASVAKFNQRDRCTRMVSLFGPGDGAGGPSRHNLERAKRAKNHEDLPRVTIEFASDFFPKLAADAKDLPAWVGELQLDVHRATLTTQAMSKKFNRLSELELRELEYLHVLTSFAFLTSADIERMWRVVLLNQFHDILPGSSITRVYEESHAQYRRLLLEVADSQDKLRKQAFAGINTSGQGQAVVVTNSLSWDRTENVFVASERKNIRSAVSADGMRVPVQRIRQDGRTGYVFPARVASMGHAVYHLSTRPPSGDVSPVKVTNTCLENDYVKVALDRQGGIRRMKDKRTRRDVLTSSGNQLLLFEDWPYRLDLDAWETEIYHEERAPARAKLVKSRIKAAGPLYAAVENTFQVGDSRMVQTIRLDAHSPLLRFDTWVDWRESHKMLKVCFPVNVHAETASYEIQYGHITHPTHRNTNWDVGQHTCVGQRWVDVSQPNVGVAMLNDCKYAHKVLGNVMSMSLLRSSKSPDHIADMGEHTFSYAILPHEGDLVRGGVVRAGAAFNVPLRAFAAASHSGEVPAAASHFSMDSEHVNIECVKKAEDEKAVILRMYEIHGTDTHATLSLGRPIASVEEVNLMEKPLCTLAARNNRLRLDFKPFELKTIKVTWA